MILSGKQVWIALGGALLVGGVGGSFLSGWRSARGLPTTEATADAGVSVSVDAGVSASSDFKFELGDWKAIPLGPTSGPMPRARPPVGPATAEVLSECTCPQSFILVPTASLSGKTTSEAATSTNVLAEAHSATAIRDVPTAALDRHFEVGAMYLRGLASGSNLVGPIAAWNIGPIGLRGALLYGNSELFAGGAVVYRFPP